ncbi:hypothetical protein bcere0026_10310 [Bacillus mycoides]|uniref:Uncharacterized protein n=1 Tax=Bacillus mycoides TaxID=1405 RepID=C2XQS3_BACMY|nr:hypothetical protein bcere0026_10310 [Bacillus mycoides]
MRKVLRHEELAARAGLLQKAEAARSECEGDGAPDVEAGFASQEGELDFIKGGSGSLRM